jgi:hypothetical protein
MDNAGDIKADGKDNDGVGWNIELVEKQVGFLQWVTQSLVLLLCNYPAAYLVEKSMV